MKTFAAKVGLSAYTLRYYEKIGLLRHIQRRANGHRVYSTKDVDWVGFIRRLKETGMPLERILEYATLREQGSETLKQRQHLLGVHRLQLTAHIAQQQQDLAALEDKINLYKSGEVS